MPLCKSCGAEIDWAKVAATGKAMPVDHGSAGAPGGTLAVWRNGDGSLWCRVLKGCEAPEAGVEVRGMAHWGTCPSAIEHRRRKGEV